MVSVDEVSLAVERRSQERLTVQELEELLRVRATARGPKARTAPTSEEHGEELGGGHGDEGY